MVSAAHRVALVTAAATLVLIVFGGLVTNTGSALVVPDWPTTFGHNMFLYPWSQMVGGVFYEHSHRLLGAVVGLLTLALGLTLWRAGGGLRALGVIAVVAVVGQGVLGGLRVVLLEQTLAILHGCLAQAFFALVTLGAVMTSPRWQAPPTAAMGEPSTRGVTLVAAGLVYLQIVFGALLTHAGLLSLHLTGALAIFALVPVVTARLRRSRDPVAAPLALALLILLAVQLLLGAGSLVAWLKPGMRSEGFGLILAVTHRLTAALILAATVSLAARSWATRLRARRLVEVVELPA